MIGILRALLGITLAQGAEQHLLYVAVDGGLHIRDIEDSHRLVRTIPLPEARGVRGICASATNQKLYLSFGKCLLCLDLRSDQVLWKKEFGGADRMAMTPDGKKLFVPLGSGQKQPFWIVVDGESGEVIDKVLAGGRPHNTICCLDGTHVYLAAQGYRYLSVMDAKTNQIIKKIGPFSESIRPFTINSVESHCFVNVDRLLGFEIGDISTGQVLYRVEVQGFPLIDSHRGTPSHGIGLTPNEKEAWVIDGGGYLHVFDLSQLPPKQVADIQVSSSPGWITFSLDGRFAYPSSGDVIDVKARERVGKFEKSEKMIEIHFAQGKVIRVGDQFGLGRARR